MRSPIRKLARKHERNLKMLKAQTVYGGSVSPPPLTLGNLDGRFEEAADLIARSWKENKDQTLEYNPKFLASCYEYPGTDPTLSPAFYDDGRLVAFVSAFPRTVQFQGERLRLALLTFFTVSSGYKGAGIGKAVWTECLRRAQQTGYDGAIHYCVDGNVSNHVTVAAAASLGLESSRVFTVNYLINVLRSANSLVLPEFQNDIFRQFQTLANPVADRVPFARIWSPEEVQWNCSRRYGSICAVSGQGKGMLTGYTLSVAGQPDSTSLFLEDIFWDDLDETERSALLSCLLEGAGSASVAVVPLWGYFDPAPFLKARFRRSTRKLHAYVTLWGGRPVAPPMERLYMDVF